METRFRSICTIRFEFCKTAHNFPLRVCSKFRSSGMSFYVTGGHENQEWTPQPLTIKALSQTIASHPKRRGPRKTLHILTHRIYVSTVIQRIHTIFVINQLNAKMFLYYTPLHVSSTMCSSSGGQNFILYLLSTCAPDGHLHVWWYQMLYNTILTSWWRAHSARNM